MTFAFDMDKGHFFDFDTGERITDNLKMPAYSTGKQAFYVI